MADVRFDLDGWRASSLTFPEAELQILDANGERNTWTATRRMALTFASNSWVSSHRNCLYRNFVAKYRG